MADSQKFVQMQPKQLAGSGAILGATSVIIQDFTDIDGNALTMTDFGSKGWGTIEPGSGGQEEQISFTGITANGNGTSTLTGVKSVGFVAPYTETAGLLKSHSGGTVFVISNTAAFYNALAGKDNDELITGTWTFTNPNVPRMDATVTYAAGSELWFVTYEQLAATSFAGTVNASTTVKGIVEEATLAEVLAGTAAGGTAARLFINPSTYGPRNYYGYAADAGGTDAYAITLSPVPTAYADGMVVQFKANTVNTGACTLNVNALGAIALKMNKDLDPVTGYIKAGQSVTVIYNSTTTTFQILSVSGKPSVSQTGEEIYAADAAGSDTYAITLTPAPVAYVTGMVVRFFAQTANTGACTLNVNALGAKTIKKNVSADLDTGDILASQLVELIYDGTNFQILSTIPSGTKIAVVTTNVTVTNTTTETALVSVTVPANTLLTNNAIRVRLNISQFNHAGGGNEATLRFKYGATTLISVGSIAPSAAKVGVIEFDLFAAGATNSQESFMSSLLSGVAVSSNTAIQQIFLQDSGTSAIDSTSDQTLAITIQWANADVGNSIVMLNATVEKIR